MISVPCWSGSLLPCNVFNLTTTCHFEPFSSALFSVSWLALCLIEIVGLNWMGT
jgi:hypothetical protein